MDLSAITETIDKTLSRDMFCLVFIDKFIKKHAIAPSMQEIAMALQGHGGGHSLKGSAYRALRRLEKAGHVTIVRENGRMRPGGIVVESATGQN